MPRFLDIYAVGANYAAHNREMGRATDERFLVFQKSTATLLEAGAPLVYPPDTNELHHEGELVLVLGEGGSVAGFAAGFDFTRRDLQKEAKARGEPWFPGKNFPGATAIGEVVPADRFDAAPERRLTVSVNGRVRQEAPLGDMLRTPAEVLRLLARIVPLRPGDAVFTGTPAGVGALVPGDVAVCAIEGLPPVEVRVVAPTKG